MLVEPGSRERSTVPHGTCIMLSEICHGATMLLKPTCRSPVLVTTSPRRCSFESCVAIPKRGRGLVLLSRGVSGRFMLSMKPRQKPPGCVLPASRNDDSPLASTISVCREARAVIGNGRSRCGGHFTPATRTAHSSTTTTPRTRTPTRATDICHVRGGAVLRHCRTCKSSCTRRHIERASRPCARERRR